MSSAIIFILSFAVFAVLADAGTGDNEAAKELIPSIAFMGSVVVTVLGFLLKFLITRDRASIDKRIDDLGDHVEKRHAELRGYIDGVGIKVERLTDVVDEKVDRTVEELRRHDDDIYLQLKAFNRELGVLQGEHRIIQRQGHNHNGLKNKEE